MLNRRAFSLSILAVSLIALAIRMQFPPAGIDLDVYVGAGAALRNGVSPYSADFSATYGGGLPFVYPPFAAAIAVALSYVPVFVLLPLWTAIGIAVLFYALRDWLEGGLSKAMLLSVLALSIWLTPITDSLVLGQVGIFVVVGTYFDAKSHKPYAGALIGLLAAVKLLPGLLALYFLLTRQWRKLVLAVATFLICSLIGELVLRGGNHQYFSLLTSETEKTEWDTGFYANQSLLGLLARLQLESAWLPLAVSITVVALLASKRLMASGQERVAVVVVGLCSCLVSPITWQHHMVWIVPAALLVCKRGPYPLARWIVIVGLVGVYLRFPQVGSHLTGLAALLVENWLLWFTLVLFWFLIDLSRATQSVPAKTRVSDQAPS